MCGCRSRSGSRAAKACASVSCVPPGCMEWLCAYRGFGWGRRVPADGSSDQACSGHNSQCPPDEPHGARPGSAPRGEAAHGHVCGAGDGRARAPCGRAHQQDQARVNRGVLHPQLRAHEEARRGVATGDGHPVSRLSVHRFGRRDEGVRPAARHTGFHEAPGEP